MGRVNAGTLRERITLLTPPAKVSDGGGGWVASGAEPTREVFAEVLPGRGSQRLRDAGIESAMSYEVRVRQHANPTTAERLIWNGLTLKIAAVALDPAREFWTITAYDAGS